jgi:hypothetical protein
MPAMLRSKWFLELVWWIFTGVVCLIVLLPLTQALPDYPFLTINLVSIITFITFTRYIFLLNLTFLTRHMILKIILSLACVPWIFYLVSNINYFQTYLDEQGVLSFMGHLSPEAIDSLTRYMHSQLLLFSVGSVIVSTLLPFRLLASVWRQYNKKNRM